jgi:glycosyltransferase involved in cell wall biosynthesis
VWLGWGKIKYAIVISTHRPPLRLFRETLQRLSANPNMHIYVIDSSPEETAKEIENQIQKIKTDTKQASSTVEFFKVPNYGIGYSYNFGIKQATKENCDLITLFTDDVKLNCEQFPLAEIYDYFSAHCNPQKDILILPHSTRQPNEEIKKTVDSGMTFSTKLPRKIRFRENLILDQIDFDFCNHVIRDGGKFVVYPKSLIDILPVGREIKNGERSLPLWRLYLLTRNAVFMGLEGKRKLRTLRFDAYPQISHFTVSALKSGQNTFAVLATVCLGLLDGVSKNLGVTSTLQKLSNHRFSTGNVSD